MAKTPRDKTSLSGIEKLSKNVKIIGVGISTYRLKKNQNLNKLTAAVVDWFYSNQRMKWE